MHVFLWSEMMTEIKEARQWPLNPEDKDKIGNFSTVNDEIPKISFSS